MQSVKCGRCKSHHTASSYAEVRAQVEACYAQTALPVAEEPKAPAPKPAPKPGPVTVPADGFYTVVFEDGDHLTLRLATQDEDEDFMPGRTLVGFLMGPDNTNPLAYNTFGHFWENGTPYVWKRFQDNERLEQALRIVAGDPSAAREAYAMQSERCARCNRVLTVPASVHRGVGPKCAERLAA